ncbi:hypothetical protein [Vibrio anguillarum]|uniref:Uncharacterized protein n=1 Tax=Vibrio anguillarum TaxID=55601 RepID=A0ABD4QZT2_VIBAN|nr:hypothetical protein [Vibrio anguillarum]MBT2920609.1 hypothetical protein [Vibrio anguillarum]
MKIKHVASLLFAFVAGALVTLGVLGNAKAYVTTLISIGGDLATIATGIVAFIALTTWKKQHTHSEQWKKLESLRTIFESYVSAEIGYWFAEEKRLMVQNGVELFPFKKIITDEAEINKICGEDVFSSHRRMTQAKLEYERAYRSCSTLVDLPIELNPEHIRNQFQSLFEDFHNNFIEFEVNKGQRVQRKYYSDESEDIFIKGEACFVELLSKLK